MFFDDGRQRQVHDPMKVGLIRSRQFSAESWNIRMLASRNTVQTMTL